MSVIELFGSHSGFAALGAHGQNAILNFARSFNWLKKARQNNCVYVFFQKEEKNQLPQVRFFSTENSPVLSSGNLLPPFSKRILILLFLMCICESERERESVDQVQLVFYFQD